MVSNAFSWLRRTWATLCLATTCSLTWRMMSACTLRCPQWRTSLRWWSRVSASTTRRTRTTWTSSSSGKQQYRKQDIGLWLFINLIVMWHSCLFMFKSVFACKIVTLKKMSVHVATSWSICPASAACWSSQEAMPCSWEWEAVGVSPSHAWLGPWPTWPCSSLRSRRTTA